MLSPIQKKYHSALTIGNASEIVVAVIKEIAGNDISNSLNGSKVTTEVLQSLVIQRLNRNFTQQAKAV